MACRAATARTERHGRARFLDDARRAGWYTSARHRNSEAQYKMMEMSRNQRTGGRAGQGVAASRPLKEAERILASRNQRPARPRSMPISLLFGRRAAPRSLRTIWPCRSYQPTPSPAGSRSPRSCCMPAVGYLRGTFSMPLMQNTPHGAGSALTHLVSVCAGRSRRRGCRRRRRRQRREPPEHGARPRGELSAAH